jgi:hypothetical protein
MTDDATVIDFDPTFEPVGEPERARGAEAVEVVNAPE